MGMVVGNVWNLRQRVSPTLSEIIFKERLCFILCNMFDHRAIRDEDFLLVDRFYYGPYILIMAKNTCSLCSYHFLHLIPLAASNLVVIPIAPAMLLLSSYRNDFCLYKSEACKPWRKLITN